MTVFLLALVAGVGISLGAGDQVLLAALTARQGRRPGTLLTALACGVATAALACWLAGALALVLPETARRWLAALALGGAALAVLRARPVRLPVEPTHSLGALALVLLARQLTDASRFGLFAIVLVSGAPWAAALGGALASGVLGLAGWAPGARWLKERNAAFIRGAGLAALAAALWLGVGAH